MNEQTPPLQAPPRRKDGQAARLQQRRGDHKKMPRPMTPQQSQMLGYAVLGVGVIAALSVLILAFRGFGGGGDVFNVPEPAPQVAEKLQEDISRQPRSAPPAPAQEPKLVIKRQKINSGNVTGGWKALIGDYIAVIQMDKGAYQIILAPADPVVPRLYSSGTYSVLDDIITFRPRSDWKAPTPPAGVNIRYERLTRSDYSMIVGFKDGAMIWQNVPEDEKRISAYRSPLLIEQDEDYIVWKKAN
jgi:hypothetical protein